MQGNYYFAAPKKNEKDDFRAWCSMVLALFGRYGCGICREHARELSLLKPALDNYGVAMMALGRGVTGLQKWKKGGCECVCARVRACARAPPLLLLSLLLLLLPLLLLLLLSSLSSPSWLLLLLLLSLLLLRLFAGM